jgi:hypothetical protein
MDNIYIKYTFDHLFMIDLNNHTMVRINTFAVDLKLQHTDGLSVYGLYELSIHPR